jgi:hypothetical protein
MSCATSSSSLHVVVDDQHVGLLVRAGDGFRFVAADPAFRLLDGSRFRRLEQVQRAAGAMKMALREMEVGIGRPAPDTRH